jgi:transcriptional regulator with XRE-family HTH domain
LCCHRTHSCLVRLPSLVLDMHTAKVTVMNAETRVTGRLIAAARALTGISTQDLAGSSGVPIETLARMEASGSAWLQPGGDLEAVSRALEAFGAVFIPESDGIGAGVRLKFMRQDVRQIGRLEGEGGIVADDDVP